MSSVPQFAGREGQKQQLRAAFRLGAKLCQNLRSDVRDLEAAMERLRDRTTVPSRVQADSQITPRFNRTRDSFLAVQRGLAELLSTYY